MLNNLFGKPKPKNFYKRNLKWTDQFINNNIYNIERNYSLYPHRNRWNCNCHVIHDDDGDVYPIDYKFLRKEYEKLVVKVTKKFSIKEYHLSDIWYNYYKQGQYQESHIHEGNGGLTAVHYLIFDPRYHIPTVFDNPKINSPSVKSGDIIFFPDSFYHHVPKNETNNPRLTIAFTVTCLD